MKILVTGGAGFIGSHVCDTLLKRGDSVICIDNFNDYYNPEIKKKNLEQASKNKNFVLYITDITNLEGLKRIFEKEDIDKIIHLAARAGVRPSLENPELYERVNVHGTENLLKLAREFRIKNFIFGSSSSVYGENKKIPFSENDPINNIISPYAETKKKAEGLCKEFHDKFNMKITCLRFFTVYGPRGRPDMATYKFTKSISNEKTIEMYGDGSSKRDYTYVKDIVDGILSSLDKDLDFEIINLGNSDPIELKSFIAVIEKTTGKKAKINQSPMQKGDVLITYADISKARKLLGYDPKVKIEDGLKLFLEWYKQKKLRCLVTGGAGFIGSNLALELEKQGNEVIIVDNFSSGHKENIVGFNGKIIDADISKNFEFNEKLDIIFHEAAITDPRFEDDDEMVRANVEGFKNIIKLAKRDNAKLIYASTANLYGNGPTPMKEDQEKDMITIYGKSKLMMDELAKEYFDKMYIVGLRYFNVFGPREALKGRSASMIYHLGNKMKAGKRPRIFKMGEQIRDHIYVKDAVRATILAINAKKSEIYNVGTGIGTSFNELIVALNEALGTNLKPEYFESPYDMKTYQSNTQADTTKAEEFLGFKAEYSLKQGIEDYKDQIR